MAMANVICIKWGSLFGPEYVNRLYSGARRNLTDEVRFFCMTEDAEGLHPDIELLDLPREPYLEKMDAALSVANRQGAMRKVSLFRPGLIPDLEGPILGFDLDVVITGNLDDLLFFEPGKVAMRADWVEARRGRKTGHGSVFRYDPALHGWLYDTLAADPTGEVEKARGSEQRYTSIIAQERGEFAYLPPDQVVSFKHGCLHLPPMNYVREPRLPEAARVVCFHGRPKMSEAVEGYHGSVIRHTLPCSWLREHWIERAREDLGPDWG
ncbi:glycosyl transferase [Tropicimonas sp. TH_r6]|uniref:glycosyl transferase n=1 Tax=Tropicimonas sp. TH_r6 TaxID=3082085 RepID=UPI00295486E4|nr:glycosyl transferase [Tropicimonas sp. TH_r6]MDV7142172.1 glycosyl transferase [Tropicimonas sp. TH_r6]